MAGTRGQELRPSHCLAWVFPSLGLPSLPGEPRRVAGAVPALRQVGEELCTSELCLLRAWPKGGVISAQHLGLSSLLTVASPNKASTSWEISGWGKGVVAQPEGNKGRSVLETMTDRL